MRAGSGDDIDLSPTLSPPMKGQSPVRRMGAEKDNFMENFQSAALSIVW